MNKEEFLKEVRKEVKLLKKHATAEQLLKLNAKIFNPAQSDTCVYGQITGNCQSIEAKRLMDLCCKKIFVLAEGAENLVDRKFSDVKALLGEKYKGQTWDESIIEGEPLILRSYEYMTVLEGYTCLKRANIEGLIDFLKSKTTELEL